MVQENAFGGMAEWFKAAVLKTVVRKYRGFESYSLRHFYQNGEMTELADGARLLSECGDNTPPRVRIPLSPPPKTHLFSAVPARPFTFYAILPNLNDHPDWFADSSLPKADIVNI